MWYGGCSLIGKLDMEAWGMMGVGPTRKRSRPSWHASSNSVLPYLPVFNL